MTTSCLVLGPRCDRTEGGFLLSDRRCSSSTYLRACPWLRQGMGPRRRHQTRSRRNTECRRQPPLQPALHRRSRSVHSRSRLLRSLTSSSRVCSLVGPGIILVCSCNSLARHRRKRRPPLQPPPRKRLRCKDTPYRPCRPGSALYLRKFRR